MEHPNPEGVGRTWPRGYIPEPRYCTASFHNVRAVVGERPFT